MLRTRIDRLAYPNREKLAIARALRRNPTPTERHAWSLLRHRGVLGLKFRRQHVLHRFIVDFYCAELKLVLELDGAPHVEPAQAGYDAARTAWLESRGYRVMRLANRNVSRDGLERLLRPLSSPSPDRERGSGGEVPGGS
jgi:very-short-patch-repair endonuclease